MLDETKKADSKETRLKRLAAALIIALVLALILYFVNGAVCHSRKNVWLLLRWMERDGGR